MALKLYDDRSSTVFMRHVGARRNGSFQYRRRIPVCLKGHYSGKVLYVRSLSRDAHELARKAADLTAELDEQCARLRADWGAVEAVPTEGEATGQDIAGAPQTALQVLVGYLGTCRAPEASRNADAIGAAAAEPAPAPLLPLWADGARSRYA